ncbi:hypothetical protein SMICM17S_09196 [Streptomyces microflavus]
MRSRSSARRSRIGLDGDVEGGGGLVGDEGPRFDGDRGGDQDALEHAAGELIGVLPVDQLRVAQPYGSEQFDGPAAGGAPLQPLLDPDDLGDLGAHLDRGVEVGRRVR